MISQERVVKIQPCKKCDSQYGLLEISDDRNKLSCYDCDTYIKFVSKKDLHLYEDVSLNEEETEGDEDLLQQINFKLDLLLNHFNIKV